jgi:hypothetical protein
MHAFDMTHVLLQSTSTSILLVDDYVHLIASQDLKNVRADQLNKHVKKG